MSVDDRDPGTGGDKPQAGPATGADQARMRRRFARRRRARLLLNWRRGIAVVLAFGLLAGGAWFLWFSERLSVREVALAGNDVVSARELRAAAQVPMGEQLISVDIDQIRARVAGLAAVQSVDVSREWPDAVRIEIRERTAVAVVQISGTWRGLDADGVVFRTFAAPPAHLPRVQASSDASGDVLGEAASVAADLPPELTERVDHVEVESIDTITLVLRSGRQVLWGSSEDSAQKAEVLLQLIDAYPAQRYDVSVPGSPTASQ